MNSSPRALKVLARHASMILDSHRTHPLRQAILHTIKKGDVVCDVGAGLGLLSLFALSAGAKLVYAMDCDEISLNVASHYAAMHGVTDKIIFIQGHSYNVELAKKADVIICEIIGSAAFDENILVTLADAKRRLLKRRGKIIPAKIELWGAPATFQQRRKKTELIEIQHVPQKNLLSKPVSLACVQTQKPFRIKLHVKKNFIIEKEGKLCGMAIWPKITWARGFTTDASPLGPTTHWKQCVLPIKSRSVKKGSKIHFELIIAPSSNAPLLRTDVLWKVTEVT